MENAPNQSTTALALIEKNMEVFADCDASFKEINSAMDKEIFEIRKKYSESLTSLQQKKDETFNKLEGFAVEYQDLLFSIKKSFKTRFGTFGFRVGKPRFVLTGDSTWSKITDLLKSSLPSYVRTVMEPAKDKLLADFNLPNVQIFAPAMGLKVTQDETFYIDLKK